MQCTIYHWYLSLSSCMALCAFLTLMFSAGAFRVSFIPMWSITWPKMNIRCLSFPFFSISDATLLTIATALPNSTCPLPLIYQKGAYNKNATHRRRVGCWPYLLFFLTSQRRPFAQWQTQHDNVTAANTIDKNGKQLSYDGSINFIGKDRYPVYMIHADGIISGTWFTPSKVSRYRRITYIDGNKADILILAMYAFLYLIDPYGQDVLPSCLNAGSTEASTSLQKHGM